MLYLWKNKSYLKNDSIRNRIGAVYSKYNVERSPKYAVIVLSSSLTRNICLSYMITFGTGSLMAQIFFLNFSSQVILSLVGHLRPFETQGTHRLEMTNEFFIRLILLSLLVCQTNFVDDLEAK